MSTGFEESENKGAAGLPAWVDCDYFCIHDYASGTQPCGWRGRLSNARQNQAGKLLCPRCGCATLLRIPLDKAGDPAS